jgi:hypothetical protein
VIKPKKVVIVRIDSGQWAWEVLFENNKDTGGLAGSMGEAWRTAVQAVLDQDPKYQAEAQVRVVTAPYLLQICDTSYKQGYDQAVSDQEAKVKPEKQGDEPTKPEPIQLPVVGDEAFEAGQKTHVCACRRGEDKACCS